ncbi:enoyl-CoA hydratase [Metabacillus crassostreae]|uniref:enoyl-CoA hydratase n=1 Tax=Metabacillus crassostreae TaxID=929098 RepID=UPI0019572994|nr:enoyl-CoA hydratase [Metabacillus crassostreae]MBM7605696.1 enoyl-CoA hydratase [Metabacillus crassostreae]
MGLLKVNISDFIAIVTIDNAPANALASGVLKELSNLLDEFENNDAVRVIILHGEGRFFSAGADIKEFVQVPSGEEFSKLASNGQDLFERVENYSKPIIAAIHGAALGGGLELAMSCHLRLVTEDAKLGLPELQLGIIPGFGGTQRLPKYVGAGRALEMMLTSEPILGLEAVKLGLANHAYPEEKLLEETKALASKFAQKSPNSVKAVIELLNIAKTETYQNGMKKEAELFGGLFGSNDAKEGITAFIEKRKPNFTGK